MVPTSVSHSHCLELYTHIVNLLRGAGKDVSHPIYSKSFIFSPTCSSSWMKTLFHHPDRKLRIIWPCSSSFLSHIQIVIKYTVSALPEPLAWATLIMSMDTAPVTPSPLYSWGRNGPPNAGSSLQNSLPHARPYLAASVSSKVKSGQAPLLKSVHQLLTSLNKPNIPYLES